MSFIYHILIDRFTGDSALEPTKGFTGGTLQGITEHLDYIQSLGATGILLTPFQQTVAYHGYHITDYHRVDPHFGTLHDLQHLITQVHQRGMTLMADLVANHCHRTNPLFTDGKHDDWFLRDADGNPRGFANLSDLPMFNTSHPQVLDYFTECCLELCRLGFDDLRLDHATGPTYRFWKKLIRRVKSQYPHVRFIGEVWGAMDFKPRTPLRYRLHKKMSNAQEARQLEYVGVLDGVLDFEYQSLIAHAVAGGKSLRSNVSLQRALNKHFHRYPADFGLWLFLDNHDLDRFLFVCKGRRERLEEALRFTRSLPHPCIMYYGTECGMMNEKTIFDGTSYADERVRKCMKWQ